MHLADAFIQSDLVLFRLYIFFISMCSLVIRTVLAYILFTHYNNPFTVSAIIKCIFDSELLRSVYRV